jgi:hypothetical protein
MRNAEKAHTPLTHLVNPHFWKRWASGYLQAGLHEERMRRTIDTTGNRSDESIPPEALAQGNRTRFCTDRQANAGFGRAIKPSKGTGEI